MINNLSDVYTDDVPVLSEEMLKRLKSDPLTSAAASHVSLSQYADVFHAPEGITTLNYFKLDVRVRRSGLNHLVSEFVDESIKVLGERAGRYVDRQMFLDDKEQLVRADESVITTESIGKAYATLGINYENAMAFGAYFVEQCTTALQNLPKGTYFSSSLTDENCRYYTHFEPFVGGHRDALYNFIMHLSDPGTPYMLGEKGNLALFRTQAGDNSLHGADVWHGFSTSRPLSDNVSRPRLMLPYKVLQS